MMNKTKTWKITMILEIDELSHPRKWIPDVIYEALSTYEDAISYTYEELPNPISEDSNVNDN